jgi:hypothetical protein
MYKDSPFEEPFYMEKLIQDIIKKKKESFSGSETEYEEFLDQKMPEFIRDISVGVLETTFNYCLSSKSDLKNYEKKVAKRISHKYGTGIKFFEAFLELNSKISSNTYAKWFNQFNTIEDHVKLDTLIANHVRACQVANEVLVLIKNGFADGAHARWRTLHEICITFLYLYDSSYTVIEMYNDYFAIERWKKAKEYQENCVKLEWEPLANSELSSLESEKNRIIEKYGNAFAKPYGWTMNDLPSGQRNIRELEKLVEMGHFHTIYAWSSENIHSGVSGIKYRLSLKDDEQNHFLMGPNDTGFLDPVQFTSYSLTEMSKTLLHMENSFMNKIMEELLFLFQNELVKEFSKQEPQ